MPEGIAGESGDPGVAEVTGEPVSGLDVAAALVTATVLRPARVSLSVGRGAVHRLGTVSAPLVDVLVLRPPVLPERLQPGGVLVRLTGKGRRDRAALRRRLDALLDAAVPRVADEVVGRIDLDALATRLDLTRLARTVIAEVDLPEIIRESTSAVSSEAVREVRMRGISGDEAVGRAVDRLLLRHRRADVPT